MGLFTIKEGKHYHTLFPLSTLPWIGAQSMSRFVTFDASAKYDSPAYNGEDVNKLFGLSFGFGGVHLNSARLGWRWSHTDQCIELLAYVYNDGQRNQDEQLRFPVVAQVKPGELVECFIVVTTIELTGEPIYAFSVAGKGQSAVKRPTHLPYFGLTHGLYFGGALPAPHDITVRIDRT